MTTELMEKISLTEPTEPLDAMSAKRALFRSLRGRPGFSSVSLGADNVLEVGLESDTPWAPPSTFAGFEIVMTISDPVRNGLADRNTAA